LPAGWKYLRRAGYYCRRWILRNSDSDEVEKTNEERGLTESRRSRALQTQQKRMERS
jgi:hypothetical protein